MVMDVDKAVTGVILLIIGIIVVFQIVAGNATDLQNSAESVANSSLPLANLFSPQGVILLLVMAGILLMVLRNTMNLGKK